MKNLLLALLLTLLTSGSLRAQNPISKDVFTADPAPLVHRDTLFLYTGHDTASVQETKLQDARLAHLLHHQHGALERLRDAPLAPHLRLGHRPHRGIIQENVPNSFIIHPGIIDYKGKGYFFYHNGALPTRQLPPLYLRRLPTLQPRRHHPTHRAGGPGRGPREVAPSR